MQQAYRELTRVLPVYPGRAGDPNGDPYAPDLDHSGAVEHSRSLVRMQSGVCSHVMSLHLTGQQVLHIWNAVVQSFVHSRYRTGRAGYHYVLQQSGKC